MDGIIIFKLDLFLNWIEKNLATSKLLVFFNGWCWMVFQHVVSARRAVIDTGLASSHIILNG